MSKVVPLLMFGFGLVGIGMFWSLFDGLRYTIEQFVITDEYYVLMELGWDAIPLIALVCGLLCLISAGIVATRERYVDVN